MLLAGLSTGHEIGLGVAGLAFIVFALASSFLAPRLVPDFPGRQGMSVYVIVCLVFFGAMIASVMVFGRESEAKGATSKAILVVETEYRLALPVKTLAPGTYVFEAKDGGTLQ
ncbi:MAG: hypothetical protein ACYDCH_14810, partial [Gaiellaceae bacterium]